MDEYGEHIAAIPREDGMTRRGLLKSGSAFGLVAAFGPLLAACGSASTGGGDLSSLTLAVSSKPGSWDQDYLAFDEVGLALMKNFMPYAIDYPVKTGGGGHVQDTTRSIPVFAESWTSSRDGKTWTLRIRRGIRFPSGNLLTAHDVKWSKDRAFAARANVAGLYALIGLTRPDQVEVVDDYTVRFKQDQASGLTTPIQVISLYIFDSKLMREHATASDPWAKEWAARNPTNGGAYNVTSSTSGGAIELRANPDFPGAVKPAIERVRVVVTPSASNQRVQLESGDIDIALGLSRRDIKQLKNKSGIEVVSVPSARLLAVQLDVSKAPFDDLRVRQAFAYAVPYDDILDSVYDGDARRSRSIAPIEMPGYLEGSYPFDYQPDKARSLLNAAGKNGLKTTLTIQAGLPEDEQVAVLLRDAFNDLGVKIDIAILDPADLNDRRAKKQVPMQLTAGDFWVNDVEYLVGISFLKGAFLNYSNYDNPELEQLYRRVARIGDEEKRLPILRQMQELLGADAPWLVLGQPNVNIPMRKGVSGWVQAVDGLFRLQYLRRT